MHNEVLEAVQDSGSSPRDLSATTASSPSEAYANLSLDSREPTDGDSSPHDARDATHQPSRPAPRSSSPAKRPASDMDDVDKDHMDIDTPATAMRRGSNGTSPSKPAPALRNARSTSVEMTEDKDSSTSGANGSTFDSAPVSNTESTASSVSANDYVESPQPGSAGDSIPPLEEQVTKVMEMHRRALEDGEEVYLVSQSWLERVFARTPEYVNRPGQFSKSATEGPIGPIDNSDLVDQSLLSQGRIIPLRSRDDPTTEDENVFYPLKRGLSTSQDFEALPRDAWNLIVKWYGVKPGTPVIKRYVQNTAPPDSDKENLQFEIYPVVFTVRKLRNDSAGMTTQTLQESTQLSPRIVASRSDSYREFLKAAKAMAGIALKTKVRVWRVLETEPAEQTLQPSGMLTPDASPRNGSPYPPAVPSLPKLVVDLASFTSLTEGSERELVDARDETANEKYNGHMSIQLAGLAGDEIIILEEQDLKGEYISEASKRISLKNGVALGSAKPKPKPLLGSSGSGRSSPVPAGPITRGRTKKNGRIRGTVGLTNLGNTCYMNSALQCIRSVEELSWYFIEGKYKTELNPSNPLGHGGSIAKAYAGLLASIYDESPTGSFAPKNFKNAVGRAQVNFSGYQQQDSQEFLSFLVDALHEDLNRIHKKPYIENPDFDDQTQNNTQAIKEFGDKLMANHYARNNSVATDLFTGFYKNTMVCPVCDKVSIKFDAYNLVTLQLPVENFWEHKITFIPLHGPMARVHVDIDKNATIKMVKEYVAKRFPGVSAKRIMATEVYSHKFYRVFEDQKSLAEANIGSRDDLVFYELDHVPTNFPAPKKKRSKKQSLVSFGNNSSEEDIPSSDSPLADRMVVPVFHRQPSTSAYRPHSWSATLWPSMITLTREEAQDPDEILRKVIGKVAQMTTRPILTEFSGDSEPYNHAQNGSEPVLTTEEDASPLIDPRIKDGSVQGEDNMVEVTMTDSSGEVESPESTELPEVLQPKGFIPPEFRHLFEIKYTRAGKEMITTGWSMSDQGKEYPSILSRVPPSPPSSVASFGNGNTSSGEEAEDVPEFSNTIQEEPIELTTPSSDEDASFQTAAVNRGGRRKEQRKNKKGKKAKPFKGAPGKGKDRFRRSAEPASGPEDDDGPMLVRLGEALMVDWRPEAFDAFFQGNSVHDERGLDTWKLTQEIEDPELQERKSRRNARKKNGLSLDECFAETSKSEVLSEENAWYCNRCKEQRRATKTLELWTVPDILVVHLKRFSAHRTWRDKLDVLVDFPIEGLDLSGKVGLPEDKSLIYDLFAVDNHYGGLGGGHYTASAQNFFDKQWYDYNDSSVTLKKNPQGVISSAAYLLFYRRRQDAPLGPPYLQEIVHEAYGRGSDEEGSETMSRNPSQSPAGNGLRLGGSSLNGSSSGGLGAAATPLRGGGSTSATAGSLVRRGGGVTVGSPEEDETTDVEQDVPPAYEDEGYGDEESYNLNSLDAYYPGNQHQGWDFSNANIDNGNDNDDVFDDTISNAPELGSTGNSDLMARLEEDFGTRPGMTTPEEEEDMPSLVGDAPTLVPLGRDSMDEDDAVADVVVDEDEGLGHDKSD